MTTSVAEFNRALQCRREADALAGFVRAAKEGCVRAQSLAGFAYHVGRGTAVDFERAAEWYRKAACSGDSYAIANLGVMSLLGQGMAADPLDAYAWLRSAVGLGHQQLRPALDRLERDITGGCRGPYPLEDEFLASLTPEMPVARPCTHTVCDPSRCPAETHA